MCGLLGWNIHPETRIDDPRHIVMVALLATAMDKRGGHSYGFWDGKTIRKGMGDLGINVDAPTLAAGRYLLAHTRFATTGARTVENSHPWLFETEGRWIVGAHNGMVANHDQLTRAYDRAKTCPVDSQHIFQHLIEGRDLDEIHAYGAISYAEDGQTFLARFNRGELHVLETSTGLYWASTDNALKIAAWTAGLPLTKLRTLKENRLYIVGACTIRKDVPFRVGGYYTTFGNGCGRGGGFYGHDGFGRSAVASQTSAAMDKALDSHRIATAGLTEAEIDDLVYEEEDTGDDIDGSDCRERDDPFHWSADSQAAYNEWTRAERAAADAEAGERGKSPASEAADRLFDRALVDAYKRGNARLTKKQRRAVRRLVAKTQKHVGKD